MYGLYIMSIYIKHIETALQNAENYISNIDNEILEMEGMSGIKTRHFYNNICSMQDSRYLEIGTWKGSSFCSAMSNNKMTCLSIDNWAKFSGEGAEKLKEYLPDAAYSVKEIFLKNYNKYKGENKATFIENDCWEVDLNLLGKYNIYMYDGEHSETSHYKALNYYISCLDNEFIYLVDDWNWESVKQGTHNSIKENSCNIIYKKEIITNNGKHPEWGKGNGDRAGKDGNWHNGLAIFILKKL